MKEIIERIKGIIESRGQTISRFAIDAGLDQGNFSRKMKGNMRVTTNDLDKINRLTGVSKEWLRTGVGEKYDYGNSFDERELASVRDSDAKPYYDVDFALGFCEMFNDEPNVPSKYISVPGYEKADFWCRTSGDSMKPFISNGDIIALREVQDWQSFLPLNEVYAVMTTNDIRTVKVVRKGSDDMHFTLHAYNEEYEDQEIDKSAITKVFKVLGSLKTM